MPLFGNEAVAKYPKKEGQKVERAMKEMKQGKLRRRQSGNKVANPKQAIAIGVLEGKEKGYYLLYC